MNIQTYIFQYGEEWEFIRKRAKLKVKRICTECKKKFKSIDLDVHHIVPISSFLDAGYLLPGPMHRCYGIRTRRPWHVETNLMVLCMKCHTKYHPHLKGLYESLGYKRSKKPSKT